MKAENDSLWHGLGLPCSLAEGRREAEASEGSFPLPLDRGKAWVTNQSFGPVKFAEEGPDVQGMLSCGKSYRTASLTQPVHPVKIKELAWGWGWGSQEEYN